ncbi:thioredoxin domain-containing protein [soil metagenome]
MKFITTAIIFLLLTVSVFAQKTDEALAVAATNKTFTAANLDKNVREAWLNLPATIAGAKKQFLENQIKNSLLETEAKARKITLDELYKTEVKNKVAAPTQEQIKQIYELNKSALDNKSLEEVRPQIADFLRRKPEGEIFDKFIASLKAKYKITSGKDVTAANLKPSDILATVGTRQITFEEFEKQFRPNLYEIEMTIFEAVEENLKDSIQAELLETEAAERQISSGDIIAREVTDKMKDFSDEERDFLSNALRKRLFTKYKAKILIKEPAPFVQNISIADEPSKGTTNAPVTIVMFTDFQCSACAATYPVLKRVIAEYGDKIHFVVRDFPIVSIHENAFQAALAANVANRQGKFFQYKELLYNNQNALDAESLKKYATELGLDLKKFEADMKDEKLAAEIRQDMADGEKYGVGGTPTIFVNGVKVITLSARSFRKAIERNL